MLQENFLKASILKNVKIPKEIEILKDIEILEERYLFQVTPEIL